MYCRYCGKILATADNLDRCYPSCPESLERKTGLMIPLQPYDYVVLVKERDTLRAENERLREALREIANYNLDKFKYREMTMVAEDLQEIAQQALKEVKE